MPELRAETVAVHAGRAARRAGEPLNPPLVPASNFYDGDYATHGYSSVPTYPASHGCTRNPIPYSVFIYDWISIGDTIYVYD